MAKKKSSRDLLFDTFFELSQLKRLDDVTIADILEQSGVSRSTFYRHFTDKYDLMSQFYQEQIASLYQQNYCESDSAWCIQKKFHMKLQNFITQTRNILQIFLFTKGKTHLQKLPLTTALSIIQIFLKKGDGKKFHLTSCLP